MAVNDVRIDSHSAVRTSPSPATSASDPHGARHSKPRKGRAKNATATMASRRTGTGTRSRDAVPAVRAGGIAGTIVNV